MTDSSKSPNNQTYKIEIWHTYNLHNIDLDIYKFFKHVRLSRKPERT